MPEKKESNITRILLIVAIVLSVIALIRSTNNSSTSKSYPVEVHYIETPRSSSLSPEISYDNPSSNESHVPDEWKGTFGRHFRGEDYLRSIGGVTQDDLERAMRRSTQDDFFRSSLRPSEPVPASSLFPSRSILDDYTPTPSHSLFDDYTPSESTTIPAGSLFRWFYTFMND